MKRNRFLQILSYLHFNNNEDINTDSDTLVKVNYLINYFSEKFRTIYEPKQDLSLDESMIPWKGRLFFKKIQVKSSNMESCVECFANPRAHTF